MRLLVQGSWTTSYREGKTFQELDAVVWARASLKPMWLGHLPTRCTEALEILVSSPSWEDVRELEAYFEEI